MILNKLSLREHPCQIILTLFFLQRNLLFDITELNLEKRFATRKY